jgi:hypothetical protein
MYGPYGKNNKNIYLIVIYVYVPLVKYNNPKTGDVNVRVPSKQYRYVKMCEGSVCVYPESVVTNKWSARSITVEIQSSSWHKEYGE